MEVRRIETRGVLRVFTACGRAITPSLEQAWQELGGDAPITCSTCRKQIDELRHGRAIARLVAACEQLLADAEQRPGAYSHARGLETIGGIVAEIKETSSR